LISIRDLLLTIPILTVLAVVAITRPTIAQSLRDAARDQARTSPGVPILLTSEPGDYLPKTIEDLTKESEVVLQATLSHVKSYVGGNDDRVLTDYDINVERIFAGGVPARPTKVPGTLSAPPILTVFGGDVTVDGVLIRATDNNREPIADGARYLLFLMSSRRREPGRYEIYYGGVFEIVRNEARPLLRHAERVFKLGARTPISELIRRIEKTAQSR
jgi:hypothetical protein